MAKRKELSSSWQHPSCKYVEERDQEGSLFKVTGTYSNGLAIARFSVNRQNAGAYIGRGSLSMLSDVTGKVLRNSDGQAISADIRLTALTEHDIKLKVVAAFEGLYSKNFGAIHSDLSKSRADDLYLTQAIEVFGRYFLIAKNTKLHLVDKKLQIMKKTAVQFDRYKMDNIPQDAIRRLRQEKGSAVDDAYHLFVEFFGFLIRNHRYFGLNHFAKYFEKHPWRVPRDLEDAIDTLVPKSLTDDVTLKLRREIESANADDAKTTGLLLVYGAGLPPALACELYWRDVIFGGIVPFDDSCQIIIQKDKTAGATHNYTRPVCPFGARELLRRYRALVETAPSRSNAADWLAGQKILGDLEPKELTAHCRDRLRHLGMGYTEVTEARTKTRGGGVVILLQDYYYRLVYHCGITNKSELAYLRGLNMTNDVTADHYRSFSAPSGQMRLYLLLCRDTRFDLPLKQHIKIDTSENGQTHAAISPGDPRRTTAVTIKIHLKSGERLEIMSYQGLQGTVRTTPVSGGKDRK